MGRRQDEDYVDLPEAICLKETTRALLVQVEGEEVWVPKSTVAGVSEVQSEGDSGVLTVERWLAEERNLA